MTPIESPFLGTSTRCMRADCVGKKDSSGHPLPGCDITPEWEYPDWWPGVTAYLCNQCRTGFIAAHHRSFDKYAMMSKTAEVVRTEYGGAKLYRVGNEFFWFGGEDDTRESLFEAKPHERMKEKSS